MDAQVRPLFSDGRTSQPIWMRSYSFISQCVNS